MVDWGPIKFFFDLYYDWRFDRVIRKHQENFTPQFSSSESDLSIWGNAW